MAPDLLMALIELGYRAFLFIDFELLLEELSFLLVFAKELAPRALLVEQVDIIDMTEEVVPGQVPFVVRRYLLLSWHVVLLICMGSRLRVVVVPVVDSVAVDVDDLGGLPEQLEALAGEVQVQRRWDSLRVRKLEHNPLRLLIPFPMLSHVFIWDLKLVWIDHHVLAGVLEVEVEALEVGVVLQEGLIVAEIASKDHVVIFVATRAGILNRVRTEVADIINHQLVYSERMI